MYEALAVTDAIRDVIGSTAAAIEASAVTNGTISIYEQARRLCEAGRTTVDEVLRVLGESD